MMNRISLSSFAFLIILLSLRIELCYGQRQNLSGLNSLVKLIIGIVVGVPICCSIICCICCCCYFNYKRRKADRIAYAMTTNDESAPTELYGKATDPTPPKVVSTPVASHTKRNKHVPSRKRTNSAPQRPANIHETKPAAKGVVARPRFNSVPTKPASTRTAVRNDKLLNSVTAPRSSAKTCPRPQYSPY